MAGCKHVFGIKLEGSPGHIKRAEISQSLSGRATNEVWNSSRDNTSHCTVIRLERPCDPPGPPLY